MINRDDPLWYKDAVIYELHIKSFFDSNNDGVGDFAGLLQKLDYLKDLGVSAIWLLPFYPSPLRDDGYDIADYRDINPTYGSMRDFRAFVRAAHERGLRVITELVVNHTSDQHPWFQKARQAKPGSAARNYYVWSDDDKKWPETRIIFSDTESSNWAWDPVAEQYYWHRFFSHQPDLNYDNPKVVKEVINIMRFWLDAGVDGLRLDAIPYLCTRDGTSNENLPETHQALKTLRRALDQSHPHAFFLAEANQWPEDTLAYFGEGDECHMAFHFPLMPRMYMAIAQEDRHPIADILRQTPDIPPLCQWAIFLRNHDELTLEMVTDHERDYLWKTYAADRRARINLGIRRRLAPLMDNDRRKIELMNSLLFSMPGTPIIYYGDEIGMGDNFFLGDRDGVRTPMQWSPDRNAGFSRADPARLYLPPIMDPIYGFDSVNVEAQQRSASSLLNWMKRMVSVRQQYKAFGRGTLTLLYPGNRKILAYLREYDGEHALCVANLSRQAQAVELDLARFKGRVPVELIGGSTFPRIGELSYLLTLPAYGFYWFLLAEEAELPRWHETVPEPMPDLITLVMRYGWADLTSGHTALQLARDVLPVYLPKQRWFAAKDRRIVAARLGGMATVPAPGGEMLIGIVEVGLAGNPPETQRYLLPLAAMWDEGATTAGSPTLPYTLAAVRRGPKLGGLVDATIEPSFARSLVDAIRAGIERPAGRDTLRFSAGTPLNDIVIDAADEIRRLGVEQSNTSILIGDKAVLKLYRRLTPGIHPEIEIGRFLTEVAQYPNVPPLLGSIELVDSDGTPTAIAALQGFVRNQGDGWFHTLEYLKRELEEFGLGVADPEAGAAERYSVYLQQAATLGRRTGELHCAFALETGDPAFDPEPMTEADMAALVADVRDQAARAFAAIERALPTLEGTRRDTASALLGRREECHELIGALGTLPAGARLTRHHGDYHLGQVLIVQADFALVDFEGEPARSLAQRRAKQTPLRDVAGMIRSFDYAAWAAVLDLTATHPDWFDKLLAEAVVWRDLTTQTFLDAYTESAAGCASLPTDTGDFRRLLDLLTLEKALYEINYEAANRPSWLIIPASGALAILDPRRGESAGGPGTDLA